MKTPIFILIFLVPCIALAQTDTLRMKTDTFRLQADTVFRNGQRTLDSLQQSFVMKSDSIQSSYAREVGKLGALKSRLQLKLDSIRNKTTQTPANPLDTVGTATTVSQYSHQLDSVNGRIQQTQQQATARIDSLKGKVTAQVNKLKLPNEAQGKVSELTAVMDKVTLPALNTDVGSNFTLPGMNPALPALPGANVPNMNVPTANLRKVTGNLPPTNVTAPNLQTNVPGMDKVNGITGDAGNLQQHVKDATGSQEGFEKAVAGKAAEQLKGLPEQKLPEVAGLPGDMPKTNEEAQQQVVQLAKKEAINHFAGKEQVLAGAMEKMAKYKQQYSSVSSLKDIETKKRHNELKGKPLRERLVPAITWQFQSWRDFMLDLNPSLGYKVTTHFTTGIGWNQRLAFNLSRQQFNERANVFGIRSYADYEFKKGFGLRLDVESMNSPEKHLQPTDAAPARQWLWGALIGIKQKYPIYKKLKGNAQLMYNIFDKDHQSPYVDRINFRIGLEFTFKRKKVAVSTNSSTP